MKRQLPAANAITEGVIWQQLLLFFFPILFGTFFQQLYNTADAVIVGNVAGKQALAAVGGSTATIINLLVGFFVGLGSGATVIISQYYGARDGQNVSRAVHTAIAMAIAGGAALSVLGIALSPAALAWMNTPEDIIGPSIVYIRIYFLGMIPSLIYNLGSGVLRAVGDSKRPLYFLMISCLVNIVLDVILVAGLQMGVAGAAIATVFSQVVSAVLTLLALSQPALYQVRLAEIGFKGGMLPRIIQIGLPAGLQSVMYSVSNIIIQSSVNTFGTDVNAAWTAYGKIDSLFWMTISSFGIAITTFVGQNFGARLYGRVKRGVAVCTGIATGFTAVIVVVLFFFGHWVYYLFTDDPMVLQYGKQILQYLCPWYFSYILIEIVSGALRGAGDAIFPMVICCLGVCVLRVVWIFVAVPLRPELETVLTSYPITWTITSVLFALYYLQGGWLRRRARALHGENNLPRRNMLRFDG